MENTDIKLQKYVSDCGLMSRRSAEQHIAAGHFKINGSVAKVGDRVVPGRDVVLYMGRPLMRSTKKVVIALNKPRGYVTTMSDELGRADITSLYSDLGMRLYPVGRLDKDSQGLLLCTNDGELANRLMHPSGHYQKVYRVTVAGKVTNMQADMLRSMRRLDDEPIAPVGVEIIERGESSSLLRMTLTQGKNRQIRRMCGHVGLDITKLERISVGPITLGSLPEGKWRHLTAQERHSLEKIK